MTAGIDALAVARAAGVWVFGAGAFARALAAALMQSGVQVQGFFTSAQPTLPSLDGLPVQALDASAMGAAALAIGVFNREPHSDYGALARLLDAHAPAAPRLWPQQLYSALAAPLGFRFWLHPLPQYAAAQAQIAAARALLEDAPSRAAFDAVLAFRREAFASAPAPHDQMQYLPDWLAGELAAQGRGALHIVDGGAYQGETLQALAQVLPVAQAWTFEPDPSNYAALVQRLADWPGPVTHLPAAIGERCTTLAFSAGAGEASHLGAAAGAAAQRVPVLAIDQALHRQPIDFIKLDVEGHELPALRGAVQTLRRCRPTLAIAAYHRWDDLWTLPAFIASLGLGYRLRLGLHGHNSFDTVLYAV